MNRREFTKMTGLSALALYASPSLRSAMTTREKIAESIKVPLGIGNHSLRAIKPNAMQLIEYAIEHKLDSVQFNTLKPFESLDDIHLAKVKKLAKANDISIYIGVGSICEKSENFLTFWRCKNTSERRYSCSQSFRISYCWSPHRSS